MKIMEHIMTFITLKEKLRRLTFAVCVWYGSGRTNLLHKYTEFKDQAGLFPDDRFRCADICVPDTVYQQLGIGPTSIKCQINLLELHCVFGIASILHLPALCTSLNFNLNLSNEVSEMQGYFCATVHKATESHTACVVLDPNPRS